MQDDVDIRPETDESEETSEELAGLDEEEYEEFGAGEDLEEMEPDEDLEPAGEQSPNTREAFEDEEDDLLLIE
ncbi:MAG: hypothetical protein SVU88_03290 [Candidatus Nanohaloarchaea archaeon]|nr:hypothetical protein [Candidatus Nanohaloarchaea archaeon]